MHISLPKNNSPRQHSVAQLLRHRFDTNSKPGHRNDNRFVCLVIEGGAMRGVVSAGMVAALECLGYRDCFDAVYGSSAGAINGAYFVAKQACYGTTIFYDDINNRSFISFRRALVGKPIVSLEFLLDEVCINRKPLKFGQVLESDVPLFIVASSINHNRSLTLADFRDRTELIEALRGSARIPFFAGDPVQFRGDRLLDASLYESIPVRAALNGACTDLLVLLTRPAGDLRSKPNWVDRNIVAPYLKRFDSTLAAHYLQRAEEYRDEIASIKEMEEAKEAPRALAISPPSDAFKVRSLEVSRAALVAGAKAGFKAVYAALGYHEPQLVEIIAPFGA